MWESSKLGLWHLGPTWTRSPIGIEIALRCDPSSPILSRHPTSCRNISRGRNPNRVGFLVQLGVLLALGVLK